MIGMPRVLLLFYSIFASVILSNCPISLVVQSEIFPVGFIEETSRTHSLLFPASDLACLRWAHRARQKQEDIDLEIAPASRDIAEYVYWGRQLSELKDVYDRTESTTVKQWILDKENQTSDTLFGSQ
jgi:hypothetical protein